MTADQEWPLNLPTETRPDETSDRAMNTDLGSISNDQWLQGDKWWADVEADRQGGRPASIPRSRELRFATGEFVERWGYEAAERFVAEVASGVTDEHASLPFTALISNLENRFGRRGLLCFGGFLVAHCAGHEHWRRRSS